MIPMTTAIRRTIASACLCTATLLPTAPLAAQDLPPGGEAIDVAGGRVFVEARGEGPTVVLLHGGMVDAGMWDDQMEALAGEFRLVRLDMRGSGASPMSDGFYPADDVLAVLDRLGVDRAHIIGLSNGGAVAIDFALAYPHRVASLILAEPGVMGYPFDPDMYAHMMQAADQLRRQDFEAATGTLLASRAFQWGREHRPEAFARIRTMVVRNLRGFAMLPRYRWHEAEAYGRLEDIRAPTLVLVSEGADPDARAITDAVARRVPDARRATIMGAGHMMNLDNPVGFNRELRRFLGDVTGPDPTDGSREESDAAQD